VPEVGSASILPTARVMAVLTGQATSSIMEAEFVVRLTQCSSMPMASPCLRTMLLASRLDCQLAAKALRVESAHKTKAGEGIYEWDIVNQGETL
jgi:hypothetical protein